MTDPGLRVTRVPSLAEGVAELASALAHPADPFETQVVCVPDAGTQRWLAQRLAERLGAGAAGDGVCAGIEFPTVAAFLAEVTERALGFGSGDNPWRPQAAAWPMLRVLDDLRSELWAAPVTAYLGDAEDPLRPGRRMSAALRLARLFHRYARYRPDMIVAWREHRDVGPDGAALPKDAAWQPAVWRLVAAELGPDPVAQAEAVIDAIAAGRVGLPARLHVVDPPVLAPLERRVLAAVAARVPVDVTLPAAAPTPPVADGPRTVAAVGNRLALRLGRTGRERASWWLGGAAEVREAAARPTGPGALGRLQAAVAAGADRPLAGPPDATLAFHASHGPDRQVEVLRDVLLDRFEADRSLEPRDVLVLCPDLPTFAPLLTAAFGLDHDVSDNPGHGLRLRVADRSLRQVNPLLDSLTKIIEIAGSRATATQLADLAAHAPVARRFGFTDDELERVERLLADAGTRWGVDPAHRARFGLAEVRQNTWAAGRDRMLLGVAMSEEPLAPIGLVLPLDDVESSDVVLVGKVAELMARTAAIVAEFAKPHRLAEWMELCRAALEALTATAPLDGWQSAHAAGTLADLAESCEGPSPLLGLGDVRLLLREALRGRPPRSSFGNGSLVVAAPGSLAHVPHRLVVGVGFDERVFPRRLRQDGDDLLARDPWAGDPDPGAEDRQALLDAVLAAREAFVLIYQGADTRTNETLPPPVPVAELLDACAGTLEGGSIEPLLVRHPLQPFAPENFGAGSAPRSFDTVALAGARALQMPVGIAIRAFTPDPIPLPEPPASLTLDDLAAFANDPIARLLKVRGQLTTWSNERDPAADELPHDFGPLAEWGVGDRLLRDLLAGHTPDDAAAAEWRRGTLPPRQLGEAMISRALPIAEAVAQDVAARQRTPLADHDIDLDLGGVRLTGTIRTRGDAISESGFGRARPRHRLAGWLQLLALTAAEPGPWRWERIGRRGVQSLGPVPPEWSAANGLARLVALSIEALTRPLPVTPDLGELVATIHGYRDPRDPYEQKEIKKLWAQECGRRPALARFFPTLAAAEAAGLVDLSRELWGPLLRAGEPA